MNTSPSCFDQLRGDTTAYRTAGPLVQTDRAMERTFWIGVYPGMTAAKLDWMIQSIREFCTTR